MSYIVVHLLVLKLLKHPDGKLLRDCNGNLIVVETNNIQVRTAIIGKDKKTGKVIMAAISYREVEIFSNDGESIRAFAYEGIEEIGYMGDNGEFLKESMPITDQVTEVKKLNPKSNCHGVSLASGKLTIFSEDISEVLVNDEEFEDTTEDNSEIVIFSDKNGNEGAHSVLKDGDKYIHTNGPLRTRRGNLEGATYGGQYKYPKFKSEIKDEYDWKGGDTSKSGLRVFKNRSDIGDSNPEGSQYLKPKQ